MIRNEVNDLDELLHLYLSLHETAIRKSQPYKKSWQRMVKIQTTISIST